MALYQGLPLPSRQTFLHSLPTQRIASHRIVAWSKPLGPREGAPKSTPMSKAISHVASLIQGKSSREKTIRVISDRIFDKVKGESTTENLNFEDVHVAILYVYNDINKYLPGSHNDPPSRDQLKALVQQHDLNLDGSLSRDEFFEFVKNITKDLASAVGKNLFLALVVAPALALLTKKSAEGFPTVGKAIKKIPTSVYASVASAAVLLLQNIGRPSVK